MSSPRPSSLLAQGRPTKLAASPAGASGTTPAASKPKSAKEIAKAEKAAKRALAKGARGAEQAGGPPQPDAKDQGARAGRPPAPAQHAGTPQKGHPNSNTNKHQAASGDAGPTSNLAASTSSLPQAATAASQLDPLQPFLHLDLPMPSSSLSHSSKSSTANIHPSILRLALQYSEFKVVGANARCIAMLEAFKDIISSYTPPPQTTLTRHLPTTHLNPQIAHLIRARPLSVSMGTAIRYLKYEISLIEMEADLDDAKALLLEKIDSFVRDRILLAGRVIEQHAVDKIKNGDTILTYARSSVVEGVLLEAKRLGKEFSVVVVDSRPLYEGKNLLHSLRLASIPTTYVLLPSLSLVLPRISLCFLGTHSLLSNGSMFSRAGTAMVAMMLKEKGVPVVCCCETYKFSERIMLDSIVGNERATPTPLLQDLTLTPSATTALPPATSSSKPTNPPATTTPSLPTSLAPLSLLYDVSRPEDVTVVITEAGLIPVQSVPVLLRDYKPVQGRNT
ncbi:translation initiation factor eIF2B subunit delta [Sporobolomyces koalae]|uniref:translation initiation factor eIF2B subunit delta n=1 Tax=Sporobolomyces koalae TaxID=500713 RepID=UPI003170926B